MHNILCRQQELSDDMTLKFTGKAGRASSLAQMKDLIKRFDDSKTRIQKLRIFKEMI